MDKTVILRDRLHAIAKSLKQTGRGLGLLGLGSAGLETARLDEYSDLDFFALVKEGEKNGFLNDTEWLGRVHPISYLFRNTPDGYKLLFQDGVFCEMAVFEPKELEQIPFSEGKFIWKDPELPEDLSRPKKKGEPWKPESVEWSLGEMLTCLYVGLCRYHRGEKLSAWRFVQCFAFDRFLELVESQEEEQPDFKDAFMKDRRFERRYPQAAANLAKLLQGYEKTPAAARALVEWADQRFSLNVAMKTTILDLCQNLAQGR